MLPKAEDPALVMQLSECGKPLWLIIETSIGAATLSLFVRCGFTGENREGMVQLDQTQKSNLLI